MATHDIRVPGLTTEQPLLSADTPALRASLPLAGVLIAVGVGVGIASRSVVMLTMTGEFAFLLGSLFASTRANWRGSAGRIRATSDESGVWFGESKAASLVRLVASVVMVMMSVPLMVWSATPFAAVWLALVFGAYVVDSFVRWHDRRRIGLCSDGLWTRTWWGAWRFADWEQVGFATLDHGGRLTIPVGPSRWVMMGRNDTNSDVRAIWGMIAFYRASPGRRRELRDGSFARTVTSGVLPVWSWDGDGREV